jgi:hypothetical protein
MIDIIKNTLGSGDWIVVRKGSEVLHEGHSIGMMDLLSILEQLGHDTDIVEVTDEQMEEGSY